MSQTTFKIPGSPTTYALHPNVKRYTLRDNGFVETKNGNFQYERPLSTVVTDKKAPVLKMTINKNFQRVRVSIVSGAARAKKVNVFAGDKWQEAREMLTFILDEFKSAEIIQEYV